MREILTITLNPALDVSASVPHVTAGAKLRCGPERYDPGGGGLNVARAIRFLGGDVRAFAALGGARGEHLKRLLEAEGIPLIPYPAPGETRESLAITDEAMGYQYRFSLPGPDWSESQLDGALAALPPLLRPDSRPGAGRRARRIAGARRPAGAPALRRLARNPVQWLAIGCTGHVRRPRPHDHEPPLPQEGPGRPRSGRGLHRSRRVQDQHDERFERFAGDRGLRQYRNERGYPYPREVFPHSRAL